MAGPRLTGPATKLARCLSTTATSAVAKPATGTIINASQASASAAIARKYADLLKERNPVDGDHSRRIYTRSSNRPHPAPQTMRLMQTFATSAPAASQQAATMDTMVIPGQGAADQVAFSSVDQIRMPLLPDNFMVQHARDEADGPISTPQINVVAANPDLVSASALTEVEGMGVDGVELKFVHGDQAAEQQPGMIKDFWNGLVDDVLGGSKDGRKLAF